MMPISIDESKQFIEEVIFSYQSQLSTGNIPDLAHRVKLLEKKKRSLTFHRKPKSVPVSVKISEILIKASSHGDFYKDRENYLSLIEKCCAASPWTVGYEAEDETFYRNFGFAEFIGPEGVFHSEEFSCGFVAMGENMVYPEHSHPAVELYEVISGPLEWRIDRNSWFLAKQGQLIHHNKKQLHAMKTRELPFLGIYTWIGDIHSPSVMKE